MATTQPPHATQAKRTRSSTTDNQLPPTKRHRSNRTFLSRNYDPTTFTPPLLLGRTRSATQRFQAIRGRLSSSASSAAESVSQYYGVGDEDALDNLFASHPEVFSTNPRPHGSRGLHTPAWEHRNDYEIYLDNSFLGRPQERQRIGASIPGPELNRLELPDLFYRSENSPPLPLTITKPEIKNALKIVRSIVGEGRRITADSIRLYERTRRWHEEFRLATLDSNEYESPPPYSPQQPSATPEVNSTPLSSRSLSSSPTPDAIPNPPIPGDPAASAETIFDSVNSFAKLEGFGIIRRHAYSHKGRKMRFSIQCDRFGEPRLAEGAGIRQRKSRKCGCKWMVIAEAIEEGKWFLRAHTNLDHNQHNHSRSLAPSAHPSHRRLTPLIKEAVASTSRRVAIRARDVRAVVEEQYPESVFTQRDIYNARSAINKEKLDGYSPTAALIKLFDEKSIPYLVKWAEDDPNRLVGLVWTFPYCLQMWKRFPEVISFDNTYNTNRFKLPLFQATGQTCLGSIYNAVWGLIDNERREGFQFLAESVRQLVQQHSIQQPDVIITDFDDAMKAALNDQFPDVQQQLCIHHINSNVLLRAKQKWIKDASSSSSDLEEPEPSQQAELSLQDSQLINTPPPDAIPHTYQGVLQMWKLVLFAETEASHEAAWKKLCKEFHDQRTVLRYLYGTYMPVRAQWARCFIRQYRNFGTRVTSGTEASNNNIKSYLLNGMSHLYRLIEAMQDMMSDQERDFIQACAADEVLTSRDYTGSQSEYLGELRTLLSSKGLGLIKRQYRLARASMPTASNAFPPPLGLCDDSCLVSFELGIPCCHKVYRRMAAATSFTKWEVHPHWRLRETTSRDPYRKILDPKIATSLRGRPRNTTQAIPARLALESINQYQGTSASSQSSQPPVRRRGRPPGSKNKTKKLANSQAASDAAPEGAVSSQRLTRSQSIVLGAGRSTGVRANGRQLQPSIRRTRSQWELIETDEEESDVAIY
jgi:MULE transposase domain